jgi:hypothetical protein
MPGNLLGNHPIGQLAGLIDLKAAEHCKVEMSAANEAKRHRDIALSNVQRAGPLHR